MSTENETPVEQVEESLDDFASTFFGQKELPFEETTSEEVETDESITTDAQTEETQDDDEDVDTLATDEDEDTEEDAKPAPKKTRLQARIDELTAKAKEAERRAEALAADLEAERSKQQNIKPKTEDVPARPADAPAPNDLKEDGTEKYPLGEFDPNYIVDLTKYTLKQEQSILEERTKQEKLQEAEDAQRAALSSNWNVQLATAQERYPDFQDKGQNLVSTFEGIDEAYGEYLTTALMSMDNGADVLYYLANNVEEAQKIVDSGPTKATIAFGRLDAAFSKTPDSETPTSRPTKVTKAPAPPPINKGSAAVASVSADTDDLDAFAHLLFKKR